MKDWLLCWLYCQYYMLLMLNGWGVAIHSLELYSYSQSFHLTFVDTLSASQEPKHSKLAMTAAFSRVLRTHMLPLKGRHARHFSVARTASRYVARGTLAGVVVSQQQIQDISRWCSYIYVLLMFSIFSYCGCIVLHGLGSYRLSLMQTIPKLGTWNIESTNIRTYTDHFKQTWYQGILEDC